MRTHYPPGYAIEPLSEHHKRDTFCCGVTELDRYFHQQIGQDKRKKIAAPFVMIEQASGDVAGYYTLSATAFPLGNLPQEIAGKLPKYPLVPATLLGRLAVDCKHQGKSLGGFLLMDALYRSLQSEIAAFAVVVDAKTEAAAAFYEKYGFIAFPDHPQHLFLPMKTVEKIFFT
jgi:predicted GNAT family N-acyltransferase